MTHTSPLKRIAFYIAAYDSTLKHLDEIAALHHPINESASDVAHMFIYRRELTRLIELGARAGEDEELGAGVTVGRVRQRLNKLNDRWRHCESALGRMRVEALVTSALKLYVADYSERVRVQLKEMEQQGTDGYAEDFLGEELYNYETLTIRDSIEVLLDEFGNDPGLGPVIAQLQAADQILKERGKEIYRPFIESGRLETAREVGSLPPSRWWYYFDVAAT